MDSLEHIRHSLAHLLAAAVHELIPGAKATLGPAIETGFYYDFEFPAPVSEDILPQIEAKMREILPSWTKFQKKEVSEAEAREFFKGNPYKQELLDGIVKEGTPITLYTAGSFTDLCRGGHAENPSAIDPESFALLRLAGAYWRGDEKNIMLTRIYGLAFKSKEALGEHLKMLEEAKKRDHRKLGKDLDLFVFSDLVGSGLPLFTPRGTILRDEINAYSQQLRTDRGFQKVWIPHITKTDLYKTSGHWEKFGDELFLVRSQETSDEFALKPMNCPHHQQIYASRPRSWRDLPVRYLETSTVYRDEKKGELGGLSRVRSITQDDSHVFCAPEQIESEYRSIMDMVVAFYKTMNMGFRARLSYRDPEHPEKYLGEDSLWNMAQEKLTSIAKNSEFEYFTAEGEAAFYGPKIDFMATDAIGREHQVATAQLDFVQPKRFGLAYVDADGSEKTPVMIHLAIAGSLERFLSIYIEHTAGVFPAWLSPEHAWILPVSEKWNELAYETANALRQTASVPLRILVRDDSETLGKKIREGEKAKVPYLLIVGEKERAANKVSVRRRGGEDLGSLGLEEFEKRLTKEITDKTL